MVPADQMQGLMRPQAEMPEAPEIAMPGYGETEEPYETETEKESPLFKYLDQGNIVDELEDNSGTTSKIMALYDEAEDSMSKWKKKYDRALNLAKLQPTINGKEITEKNFPFDGASLVMMPFILEAGLDFQSRSAPELAWSNEIVHAKVYGKNSTDKEDRATRIKDYSNMQLSELMPDWKPNQDKALLILPMIGTIYKKTYYCYEEQEVRSDLKFADQIIFNHDYATFEEAPDKFEPVCYTRNQVIGFIRGDQKWDLEEDGLEEDKEDFEFINAYTWIDLDGDGLKEPYLATIYKDQQKIVCLYPCYDEDTVYTNDNDEIVKVKPVDYFTQYRFISDPEGGPMGLGWGILLGPMFDAINTNVRQLIDAGTLSLTSANSGLINKRFASGRGNAAKDGPIEIVMGQLTPIETHGTGSLRDDIVQFPFAGPNTVLFQLMEYLINSARSMTNASLNIQANQGEAAALYLARLQQALKIPNSIIMRVYDCCKKELQKISLLNYKHFDDEKYNKILDLDIQASMQRDFDPEDFDIRMVADPSQGSDIERVNRAQVIYEMAKDPNQPGQVLDYRQAVLGVLEAMKTPNPEELAPEPDPNARNPAAEMQQAVIAQQMAAMEMQKRDQDLRQQETKLKELRLMLDQQKAAMDSAKEMAKLGLDADMQEAKIAKEYAQTLEIIVKMGMDAGRNAMPLVNEIEGTFIDNAGQQPKQAINPIPSGAMAPGPGNENLPPVPMVEPGPNQGGIG